MTVDSVKEALEELSDSDQEQILRWLDERHNAKWDRQMEQDFAPGGRGQYLLDDVKADIQAGRTQPLEDVLNESKIRA